MKRELMTVAEAAAALKIHRNTLAKWVAAGKLPVVREGREHLVTLADIEAFQRRTCPSCRKTFTATDARQKHCTPACRWAATYEKRKAEHPATRGPGRPPKPRTVANPAAIPERLAGALAFARQKPTA